MLQIVWPRDILAPSDFCIYGVLPAMGLYVQVGYWIAVDNQDLLSAMCVACPRNQVFKPLIRNDQGLFALCCETIIHAAGNTCVDCYLRHAAILKNRHEFWRVLNHYANSLWFTTSSSLASVKAAIVARRHKRGTSRWLGPGRHFPAKTIYT